ncbi:MAG: YkgJ family cysteine cluster protein [Candidatus Bathyarchaeia archaeon]
MTEEPRQNDFFNVCGECKISCCQNARPPITNERRKTIEEFLKRQGLSVENLFEQSAYTFPKEDAEGYCIFYDKKTRRCKVHPVKPETCVAGPITFDVNAKTGMVEWYLKMEKICPLAGAMYKNKEVLEKHLKSAKREIRRLLRELDANALRTILKIEEPETFKIGEEKAEKEILHKLTSV